MTFSILWFWQVVQVTISTCTEPLIMYTTPFFMNNPSRNSKGWKKREPGQHSHFRPKAHVSLSIMSPDVVTGCWTRGIACQKIGNCKYIHEKRGFSTGRNRTVHINTIWLLIGYSTILKLLMILVLLCCGFDWFGMKTLAQF